MCYFSARSNFRVEKTSAIHLLNLQTRRLRLVAAVACPMSHWVCYTSFLSSLLSSTLGGYQLLQVPTEPGLNYRLQSDAFPSPGVQALVVKAQDPEENTCCWLLPPHLSSTWMWVSDSQTVPFQWAFVLFFCLLRANEKSQSSDHCSLLPERTKQLSPACLSLRMVQT